MCFALMFSLRNLDPLFVWLGVGLCHLFFFKRQKAGLQKEGYPRNGKILPVIEP
jgi:hypothetical protein